MKNYRLEKRRYKDKRWLIERYHKDSMSLDEICDLEGIDKSTLLYWFRKHDIPRREKRRRITEYYCDKDWLYEKYCMEKLSAQKIADICGCSFVPVYYWLDKYGIKRRYKGESKRIYPKDSQSIYRETWGRKEYIEWRYQMFLRDNFICQECNKRGGDLELHHIIPCRDYEEGIMKEDNVITLCKSCHRKTFGKEYEFAGRYSALVEKV